MKWIRLSVAALAMFFSINSIVFAEEIAIKGTVVKAEDVCGIISEDSVYIIPCSQVADYDGKEVNIVGVITEYGDVQSIDATSVQAVDRL